jgi:exopolysaccharide biosynthesis protein
VKRILKKYSGLLLLLFLPVVLYGQIDGFEKVKWQREKIAGGLVWKSAHTTFNDTIPQNINILIVSNRRRNISLVYSPQKNITTSEMASGSKGIAAVNAGFFNIKNGGSQTYIKTSGRIVDSDTASKWPRVENMSGSIIIDTTGRIFIMEARPNGWYDSCRDCRDALVTGPLLLYHGKRVRLPETSIVVNRHPRTCIGIEKNGRVILLTLDGRTDQAVGMTLVRLTDLMISLKCTDAVNLDGGGSTTMWIRGKPFGGVVNMPSDNKKFDHEGEKNVADILVIR